VADDDRYVTRMDFERALRNLNIANLELRDLVLKLAAQVVTLTDELTKRLDHDTPATATIEAAVDQVVATTVANVRAADDGASRVGIDLSDEGSKYAVEGPDIPCAELIPLCRARCCTFVFALSTEDLDEGVIRFDYGQPYMIRQRSDGYCVHNDAALGCTAHAQRPRTCRLYDCRDDKRVWIDYEKRIPAPQDHGVEPERNFDLHERARLRGLAVWRERMSIDQTYPDGKRKRE
jgi:hypothetical protein